MFKVLSLQMKFSLLRSISLSLLVALTPVAAQAETFRAFFLHPEKKVVELYCVGCNNFTPPNYLERVRSPLLGPLPGDYVIKQGGMLIFKGRKIESVIGGVFTFDIGKKALVQKLSQEGYLPLIPGQ